MKFNSLKIRVLAWFTSLVAIILLVFSLFLYHSLNSSINLKIEHRLSSTALLIKENIKTKKSLSHILKNSKYRLYEIAIYKDNKLIAKRGNTDFKKLSTKAGSAEFLTIENGDFINAYYILNLPQNSIKIIIYQKNIDDKIENIVFIMFFSELVLLMLLVFLGSTLIDKILFTIKSITKTARNISVDDFSSTIPLPKYDDETKELVVAFNKMIHRLKDGTKKIERFNSDVSHELKTPLTVIKGEIEIATLKPRDISYYQAILGKIEVEANQIQDIIDNLLLLTRYTKENIKQTYKLCSLESILLNAIEIFDANLKEKDIKIDIQKIENIQLNANEILINTIFSNLIDNAIKYSPNGKSIYISLYKKDNHIHFIIKDEGMGIPKDKIDKITDRFYRVDESRNKSIKGFGLGLSIVKNSVELHDGALHVESKVGVGSKVEVVFEKGFKKKPASYETVK